MLEARLEGRSYVVERERTTTRSGSSSMNQFNFEEGETLCPSNIIPYNQYDSEECVSAALCMGLFLLVLNQKDVHVGLVLERGPEGMPSPAYVYHVSRLAECIASSGTTCSCGVGCGGVCDRGCGGLLQVGVQVLLDKGAPPVYCWPTTHSSTSDDVAMVEAYNKDPTLGADYWYVLDTVDYFEPRAEIAMAHLDNGHPIVVNLKMFKETVNFFNDVHPKDVLPTMPVARYRVSIDLEYGHCVLVVGYIKKTKMFVCINSFGQAWGHGGFFGIPFAAWSTVHIYRAVALLTGHIAYEQ